MRCLFNNFGHLIIQSRNDGSNRDIIFATGTNSAKLNRITSDGHLDLFGDNHKLRLGASQDLQIYHDGSHSYISDTGEGALRIGYGGTAELYNGSTKVFETISTGATVTGDLYVGGDLFLQDDIVLDNVNAQSLNITGISTYSLLTATRVPFVGTGSTLRDSAGFTFDGLTDSLSIAGNLSVGGTVTYEDVTNVDSVGLVTAGRGFRATTGGLIVTAGIATFGAIATFTQDAYVDGTLTAGLIDGGSY